MKRIEFVGRKAVKLAKMDCQLYRCPTKDLHKHERKVNDMVRYTWWRTYSKEQFK